MAEYLQVLVAMIGMCFPCVNYALVSCHDVGAVFFFFLLCVYLNLKTKGSILGHACETIVPTPFNMSALVNRNLYYIHEVGFVIPLCTASSS